MKRLTLGALIGTLTALLVLTLHGLHLAIEQRDSDSPFDPSDPMRWNHA